MPAPPNSPEYNRCALHLIARDKASLDIFWLKDDSLEDSENLPEPGLLAQQIVDDLEAALSQFRLIADYLGPANDI